MALEQQSIILQSGFFPQYLVPVPVTLLPRIKDADHSKYLINAVKGTSLLACQSC